MDLAQNRAVAAVGPAPMTIPTDADRRRIISRCAAAGAAGWVLAEIMFEIVLGPHVRMVRTVAIGSTIGVLAGLLVAYLQWRVLRHYTRDPGAWVVATVAGFTIATTLSSFLLYVAISNAEQFISSLQVQGVIGSALVGVILSLAQWLVLRKWVDRGVRFSHWMIPLTLGNALAPTAAWLSAIAVFWLLTSIWGLGSWPLILIAGYLTAAIVGGTIYSRFLAWGFRRVLPAPISQASEPRPAPQASAPD